ncbi:MAG: hypothetical protein QXJ68_08185 [Methanocellales archaeon]
MENLYLALKGLLEKQQLSISGISRELKAKGLEHHRLVLTGYLRALKDLGYINETEIPPSKIYSFKSTSKRDIYTLIGERIIELHPEKKFPVSVYILNKLFNRPCFKSELKMIGITPRETAGIIEIRDARIKKYRESIKQIAIPPEDPAYEAQKIDEQLREESIEILAIIIRDIMNLSGLYIKYQQTKLTQGGL